jgi:hypothetical protein
MVSSVEISVFAWLVLCLFAMMDQLSTYHAVKFTTAALGKKLSESREANPFQKFLWKHFSYEASALLGLLIQWVFYTIAVIILSLINNDFATLGLLAFFSAFESSIMTSNFLYYRRCRNLKRRYPKDYKRLMKDLT